MKYLLFLLSLSVTASLAQIIPPVNVQIFQNSDIIEGEIYENDINLSELIKVPISIKSGTAASDSNVSASDPNTFSFDSGSSGTDELLVTFLAYEVDAEGANSTNVTYDSTSMTEVDSITTSSGSNFGEVQDAAILTNPSNGSNTLSFDLGSSGQDVGFAGIVLEGVDQTTPTGNTSSAYTTAANLTTDLTVTEGSLILWSAVVDRSNVTISSYETNNSVAVPYHVTASGNSGYGQVVGVIGPVGADGTYTAGLTYGATTAGATIVAIEIKPAAAASGISGSASITINDLELDSTGELTHSGIINSNINDLELSLTGELTHLATSSLNINDLELNASGNLGNDINGSATINVNNLELQAFGTLANVGFSNLNSNNLELNANGNIGYFGSSNVTINDLEVNSTGELTHLATSSLNINHLELNAIGDVELQGVNGSGNLTINNFDIFASEGFIGDYCSSNVNIVSSFTFSDINKKACL